MAEQYEIDFKELGEDWLDKYNDAAAVQNAEEALLNNLVWKDKVAVVRDIIFQYKSRNLLTTAQKSYLLRLCRYNTPEYKEHKEKFFLWYNERPDLQELYQFGMTNAWYVPADGVWIYKGGEGWDTAWEKAPANAEMFFRAANDYSCKQFREIKRPQVFAEGELVVLRDPFIRNYRYDPYYNGSTTPDATNQRVGTVMANTEKINSRSRAGKGSRNINVLWIGTAEPRMIPERMIKSYERKRRAKKA
jgi:hypothetical protein